MMTLRRFGFGGLLGLLAVLPSSMANAAGTEAEAVASSQALLRTLLREEPIPGVSVAVVIDGRLVWAEGFGYANLEQQAPVTPRTKFRIASISKPLTMAGVARLYEAGLIDLDAPIRNYVPGFPDKGVPITVRQIAAHRSGIVHYDEHDMINTVHYPDMTHAMAKFKDRPLAFTPGKKFLYSSFGYNLLGAVVEGVTGKPFVQYMREQVTGPLGLKEIVPDEYGEIIEGRTSFYEYDENRKLHNAPAVDNSDLWPGGGYLASAPDLARFGDAVVNGSFLKPQTREMLLEPVAENVADGQSYGLGWRSETLNGMSVVGHDGGHLGARTKLRVYREPHMAIALLTNASAQEQAHPSQSLQELSQRIGKRLEETVHQIAASFIGSTPAGR